MTSISRTILPVFYALVSVLVLTSALIRPAYNWDIIPYVASAKALETNDSEAIHSFAYAEIEKIGAIQRYSPTITRRDSAYRSIMRIDEAAFVHQLSFYRIRLIYIGSIYLLGKIGMNVVFVSHAISAIAVFCSVWMLFLLGRTRMSVVYQFGILMVALAFGVRDIARLSTPDGLALLAVLTSVYLFLEDNPLLSILLPFLVAIRTDLILFVILLSVILLLSGAQRRHFILFSTAISVGVYVLLNWYYQFPGWKAVFYFTFVDMLPLENSPLTPGQYLSILEKGIWYAFNNTQFLFFSTIAGFAGYVSISRAGIASLAQVLESKAVCLLLISVLYVGSHLVVFPLPEIRFFAGFYILAAFSLFVLLSSQPGRADRHEHPAIAA